MSISNEYLNWMSRLVCNGPEYDRRNYIRLFAKLHSIQFTWTINTDRNREVDGQYLRIQFAESRGYSEDDISSILDGPASVMEMMVALAYRCEDQIMSDEDYGDRTSEWFWTMICNMNLDGMTDDEFNDKFVEKRVSIMLNREYNYNGIGGALFHVMHPRTDLRGVDIWYQMQWFLIEKYPVY